jgi:hypothetical protein
MPSNWHNSTIAGNRTEAISTFFTQNYVMTYGRTVLKPPVHIISLFHNQNACFVLAI